MKYEWVDIYCFTMFDMEKPRTTSHYGSFDECSA